MISDSIRFVLDGDIIELRDVDPTRTVLQFLREDLHRTGTKEGCAEGDCGACTVVLADRDTDGEIRLRSVNACIQFLPVLDGKELITVESLARGGSALHPVQKSMVDNHGAQCGFCTPGFVMSLFALYETCGEPGRRDIDDALAGNLCRCTGYRPIIAAAEAMHSYAPNGVEHVHADMIRALERDQGLRLTHDDRMFLAPRSVSELIDALEEFPDATLLAGGTDIGLWVTKQHRVLDAVIYTGNVVELRAMSRSATHLEIGAAVPLTDAIVAIIEAYPEFDEMFRRFASPPIRNAGTLGGNVANGSPIGDSMPALMVADATVVVCGANGNREVPLDAFYHAYQVNDLRAGEFVKSIRIPLPAHGDIVTCYKWSKRFDQDISGVCTAFRLRLDGDRVNSIRIACGGMAETVRRARKCEAALIGQPWNERTLDAGIAALSGDFAPISDMRSTADYRMRVCQNLLRRFYLESCGHGPAPVYSYGR